jgi:hypothetical protein
MLLSMIVPAINVHMTHATIMRIHAEPGQALMPGSKLMDLRVDLSAAFPQDCPPISYYRIVLRERACLRALLIAPGADVRPGQALGVMSTEADEAMGGEPARAIRVTTAGILWQPDWVTETAP